MHWSWKRFDELSLDELYRILALRAEVFVEEQASPYTDPDGRDAVAQHLQLTEGPEGAGPLLGYARVVGPGVKFAEASLGRIVLAKSHRGKGLGQALVSRSLEKLQSLHPSAPVRISAQVVQRTFYERFGFAVAGEVYGDFGVPHVEMLRPGTP